MHGRKMLLLPGITQATHYYEVCLLQMLLFNTTLRTSSFSCKRSSSASAMWWYSFSDTSACLQVRCTAEQSFEEMVAGAQHLSVRTRWWLCAINCLR
jgi:hypothetical protein